MFLFVLFFIRNITSFSLTKKVLKLIVIFGLLLSVCMINLQINKGLISLIINIILTITAFVVSYYLLSKMVDIKEVVKKILRRFVRV